MFKTNEDGTRQIHLRVSADVHRQLKIQAALSDQSINDLVMARVVDLLLGGSDGADGKNDTKER